MLKINRILCPTDLTVSSKAALQYAIALARSYEAKLYVCYCVDSFTDLANRTELTKLFEDAIRSHIGEIDNRPVNCEAIVVEGDPILTISQAAAARQIDLIVMQSRRRPLAAALMGSTAEAVCRTAPCPVLVMHADERDWVDDAAHEIKLQKILVAHDFSNDAEIAAKYAASLAQEYQAELHLVHVLPVALAPALSAMPFNVENDFQRATRLLQQSIPDEAVLWCNVKQAILAGQPYREILTYAEENQIDLICMGVHGAGFSMRALFGSNSDRVMRQSPCPVLITRPLKPSLHEESTSS